MLRGKRQADPERERVADERAIGPEKSSFPPPKQWLQMSTSAHDQRIQQRVFVLVLPFVDKRLVHVVYQWSLSTCRCQIFAYQLVWDSRSNIVTVTDRFRWNRRNQLQRNKWPGRQRHGGHVSFRKSFRTVSRHPQKQACPTLNCYETDLASTDHRICPQSGSRTLLLSRCVCVRSECCRSSISHTNVGIDRSDFI